MGDLNPRTQGIDRDLLPVAFQDTAKIAHRLNVKYLWIDILCIIQDDISDWQEETAKMGEIFENAALTIAASLSPNLETSMFAERRSAPSKVELDKGTERCSGNVFKARRRIFPGIHGMTSRATDNDPLDLRAWALQERELATRLVSFTGAEI